MKEEPETKEISLHPMEVMREYYTASGITFQEDDNALFTRLNLMNTEVHVICWGEPNDTATVVIRLPLRAAPEVRDMAGEFVNRMNFGAKRKFWEIDCDSGELRLTSYTDTLVGPLINGSHSRNRIPNFRLMSSPGTYLRGACGLCSK